MRRAKWWMIGGFFVVAISGIFLWQQKTQAIPVEVLFDGQAIADRLINKVGTVFFQSILRNTVNNLASDAAKSWAIDNRGKQPLFVTESWWKYLYDIDQGAAGQVVSALTSSYAEDETTQACKTCQDNCNKDQTFTASPDCLKKCESYCGGYNPNTDPKQCTTDHDNCKLVCAGRGQAALDDIDQGNTSTDTADVQLFQSIQQTYSGNDDQALAVFKKQCEGTCDTTYQKCLGGRSDFLKASTSQTTLNYGDFHLDICRPDLSVALKISLGLTNYNIGPIRSDCSYTDMKNRWSGEADRLSSMMNQEDFIAKFATQFINPTGTDLGLALVLSSQQVEQAAVKGSAARDQLTANQGWLDLRSVSGGALGTPGDAQETKKLTDQAMWDNIGKVTGDIFVDAANIFINQWLLTSYHNLTQHLVDNKNSTADLANPYGNSQDAVTLENKLSFLKEPSFSDGGDFDVTQTLATCQDESQPTYNTCVINQAFAQAVNQQMVVGEAVKSGLIKGDLLFGFDNHGQDKLNYSQGYPYRSLIILRKYLIIPVGWELAAQKIQTIYLNQPATQANADIIKAKPAGISLNDLLACYDHSDSYTGYYDDWCAGLVNPSWLLKSPRVYCAKKGYGPDMVSQTTVENTGRKLCSRDGGATIGLVSGQEVDCQTDADCQTLDKQLFCKFNEVTAKVNRSNSYCADEQTCIKEDKKNCKFYGYCTEDAAKWLFDKNYQDRDCEPVYNTCQAFTATTGSKIALLKNTLQYSPCDTASDGCQAYAASGAYDVATDKINWFNTGSLAKTPEVYLNKQAATCDAKGEGCRELVKADTTTNLIPNESFEDGATTSIGLWPVEGTMTADYNTDINFTHSGNRSLHLTGAGDFYSNDSSLITGKTILPTGFIFDQNETYTWSAWVYLVQGDVEMGFGSDQTDQWQKVHSVAADAGVWQQYNVSIVNDEAVNADKFYLKGLSASTEFYVDDIQLRLGQPQAGSLIDTVKYLDNSKFYQKIIPDYLVAECYQDFAKGDYNFKVNAPDKCLNYGKLCNQDQVGCELYTDILTKQAIPAKAAFKDYCPDECVGYDAFVQKANLFNSARPNNFIAATASKCSLNNVGCSHFTNLDQVPAGGEGGEYFSKLRACVKPDTDKCTEFYTWEGKGTGQQLVDIKLVQDEGTRGKTLQPATINDDDDTDTVDTNICDETVFALHPGDPNYNPDCRQFYGRDGKISYHLYSNTISCSDDCHPYRLEDHNVDPSVTDASQCQGADRHWDANNLACQVCLSGGVWQDEHQACIYMALPSESKTCSASNDGCSEYAGNFANNVHLLMNDTFDAQTTDGWTNGQPAGLSLTSDGYSLVSLSNFFQRDISGLLTVGQTYNLRFLAKTPDTDVKLRSIYLTTSGGAGNLDIASDVALSGAWQEYTFNFTYTDNGANPWDTLFFQLADGSVAKTPKIYFDYVQLFDVGSDRYYLIRDSWKTPDSCDRDAWGQPHPGYMLSCRQYRDRAGVTYDFHSFSHLCEDSGIGCQLMIDTHNTSDESASIVNDDNKNGVCDAGEIGCINTPADNALYAVYDKNMACDQKQVGCQRLGLSKATYNDYIYDTDEVYLINNAGQALTTSCAPAQRTCQAWKLPDNNLAYFKNPGFQTCQWQDDGQGVFGWYRSAAKTCAGTDGGEICNSDADCVTGVKCQDHALTACAVDGATGAIRKTIGQAEVVQQPATLAGLCPTDQSTCTEYIEPLSSVNPNLVINPSYADTDGDGVTGDGWVSKNQNGAISPFQTIILKTNQLYSFTAQNINNGFTFNIGSDITCNGAKDIYYLKADNSLAVTDALTYSVGGNKHQQVSEDFYVADADKTKTSLTCQVDNGGDGHVITIRPLIVNYKIKDSLKTDTPDGVDYAKGQILFNERSYGATGYQPLLYDAKFNSAMPTAVNPSGDPNTADTLGMNDANTLLQVSPDRECSKWLACRSYITDPTDSKKQICVQRGLCDQLGTNGECLNFVDDPVPANQAVNAGTRNVTLASVAYASGYSQVGYLGANIVADDYPLADMRETDGAKLDFNGSFEDSLDSGFSDQGGTSAKVISDAKQLQQEFGSQTVLAPDGQRLLKLSGVDGDIVNPVRKSINGLHIGDTYVVSASLFLVKGQVSISLQRANDQLPCPATDSNICESNGSVDLLAANSSNDPTGQWLKLTKVFTVSKDYHAASVYLNLASDGQAYIDDIKIEPALNQRCAGYDGNNNCQGQDYVARDCRLYPRSDALSCDYYDNSGIKQRGWSGYCLNWDPRDPTTCLMWYPLDKVGGEDFEGGAGLNLARDVYYSTYVVANVAKSSSQTDPGYYCGQFIKVDKTKYWYERIKENSNYQVPRSLLDTTAYIDCGYPSSGASVSTSTVDGINWSTSSGLYGAYNADPLEKLIGNQQTKRLVCGNQTSSPYKYTALPFMAYGGEDPNVTKGWVYNVINSLPKVVNAIKGLFASTEGNPISWATGTNPPQYIDAGQAKSLTWNVKDDYQQCCAEGRPHDDVTGTYSCDDGTNADANCYVQPRIDYFFAKNLILNANIGQKAIQGKYGGYYLLHNHGFVNFAFTSAVDSQQLPLRSYSMYMGYNYANADPVQVSGHVDMFDKPTIEDPHLISSYFDYATIKKLDNNTGKWCGVIANVTDPNVIESDGTKKKLCQDANNPCCLVLPNITITDNWDETSDEVGALGDTNPAWAFYGHDFHKANNGPYPIIITPN